MTLGRCYDHPVGFVLFIAAGSLVSALLGMLTGHILGRISRTRDLKRTIARYEQRVCREPDNNVIRASHGLFVVDDFHRD